MGKIMRIQRNGQSAQLIISAQKILEDIKEGDSIAVNGICLTATSYTANSFTADVMHETLDRTALGTLKAGSQVNLERAMAANGRFGGHIVAGHIDGTGTTNHQNILISGVFRNFRSAAHGDPLCLGQNYIVCKTSRLLSIGNPGICIL